MAFKHISTNTKLDFYVQKAKAERVAVFRAAGKAIGRAIRALFHGIVDSTRRTAQARRTYRELSALSDHYLRDIGIDRSEIASVAQAVAAKAPDVDLTIAELRPARNSDATAKDAKVVALSRRDERRRRPLSAMAERPSAAPQAETEGVG